MNLCISRSLCHMSILCHISHTLGPTQGEDHYCLEGSFGNFLGHEIFSLI